MSRRKAVANNSGPPSPPRLAVEFRPRTKNQANYIRTILSNDITFCVGPAGSGKTLCAVAVACQQILDGAISKIVISRPCVEAAPKSLGALPGNLESKVSPYLIPATEMLKKYLGRNVYVNMYKNGQIVIEPLEFMRGRTFDNSVVIGEEFQCANTTQIKMFVTRIGENSRMIISGDIDQADIRPTNSVYSTDLEYIMDKVERADIEGFGFCELFDCDIQRHRLISPFLRSLRN